MKKIIAILALATIGSFSATAQEDVPNCKDSPMFNRMPNEFIQDCSHNFNQLEIPVGKTADGELKSETKEGTLTFIQYVFTTETGTEAPSFFQICKNYENAVVKNGGKKVFYFPENGTCTYYAKSGEKEIWIILTDLAGQSPGNYELRILEIEGMKQEISASDILVALNTSGFIALYINFDSGKSDIKTESQPIIDQLTEMMKANPNLKISIEGHTDNVGSGESNKILSLNRAKAVTNALIAKGINATSLASVGWGQEKPIADNRTEDGKAKNRRVEIVKK